MAALACRKALYPLLSQHDAFYHSSNSVFLPLLAPQMPNEGSLVLIIILIVLQGVTGISFGLVISSAIDDEQSANQAALGIFYPNLIISGRHDRTAFFDQKKHLAF